MAHLLFWIGLLLIFHVGCQPGLLVKPLFLDNFQISLFSEDLILSSVIWLQPPSCLYEEWMRRTLVPSMATRKMSSIRVEVQTEDRNETYIVPDLFDIPQCKTIFGEPPPTEVYVFQVGPNLSDQTNTQIIRILPGTAYKVRYVLYNHTVKLAYTNWSEPFKTLLHLDTPVDHLDFFSFRDTEITPNPTPHHKCQNIEIAKSKEEYIVESSKSISPNGHLHQVIQLGTLKYP